MRFKSSFAALGDGTLPESFQGLKSQIGAETERRCGFPTAPRIAKHSVCRDRLDDRQGWCPCLIRSSFRRERLLRCIMSTPGSIS
jgi:hypothetical protein